MAKRMKERRAAVVITIIICAIVVCFLPACIVSILRQFVKSIKVPAEVLLVKSGVFMASSICNPTIYSIRKREFRTGLKNVLRRIGLNKNSIYIFNEVIVMDSVQISAELATEDPRLTPVAVQATQYQDERLSGSTRRAGVNFQKRRISPIPEVDEELD